MSVAIRNLAFLRCPQYLRRSWAYVEPGIATTNKRTEHNSVRNFRDMQVVKENIILAPVTTTTDLHADIMYGIQTMIYALTKTQLVS